jgi:solute carrier family 25 (adenine nucleotide translocator) protein 4/5/6/31
MVLNIIANPTRLQLYSGVTDAMAGIYRNEGITAYWKGNYANCVRIVPVCALKFTFFDNLKTLMLPHGHNYSGFELWARKVRICFFF